MEVVLIVIVGFLILFNFMFFVSLRNLSSELFCVSDRLSVLNRDVSRINEPISIPIILEKDAFMPLRKHGDEDACYDIVAPREYKLDFGRQVISTGVKFSVPKGFVAIIFPTSGNTVKGLVVNSKKGESTITDYRINGDTNIGIIDPGYTGEIGVLFNNHMNPKKTDGEFTVQRGTKLGQIMFLKTEKANFVKVDSLENSKRGTRGYGSSDFDNLR